jgi:hypothetical protein
VSQERCCGGIAPLGDGGPGGRRLLFAALFALPVVLGLAWLGLVLRGMGRVPEVGGGVRLTAEPNARL